MNEGGGLDGARDAAETRFARGVFFVVRRDGGAGQGQKDSADEQV
jgi:hypothetical protein